MTQKTIFRISLLIFIALFLNAGFVNSQQPQQIGGNFVQTNSATNISQTQAILNGYFSMPYLYSGTNNVWFQWGTDTNYYYQTSHQSVTGNYGNFSQNIANLSAKTTYHFRAVMQNNSGTVYGQDMTFYTGSSVVGSGALTVSKKVINLTSGNLNWQTSVNANPGDILSFAITLQATGGQNIHNIYVQDILPQNLIYRGNTVLNAVQTLVNPASGINIGTIPAGNIQVISYQAQVAPSSNFAYGSTTLSNVATITSNEAGTQTATSQILVNNSQVYGATTIVTGQTNNILRDSFFLPLLLIVLMLWIYFSKTTYKFTDWLQTKIK